MVFRNGVKNIQAAAYNGARTVFIDLPKIRTGEFSLLLKYLSLFPIKPQINLYVWTALSAIANVI